MPSLDDLTAQAIGAPSKFNWTWFIELCVCGILTLFFLFYFNRLFATLISYGLRAYGWHHYRVWVDIQALQISLLGGRIFFKGIRYHGENETVFIQSGFVTWRYWIRSVRYADLTWDGSAPSLSQERKETSKPESESSGEASAVGDEEHGSIRKKAKAEARIAIFVTGLEWFIYNRTPMYDAILKDIEQNKVDEGNATGSSTGKASGDASKHHLRYKLRRKARSDDSSSSTSNKSPVFDSEKLVSVEEPKLDGFDRKSTTNTDSSTTEADVTLVQSLLVQLFPVYIECSKSAVSIGNEHTRAILVTTFDKAMGHIDASGCGPHDTFRQLFDFEVEHPVVQMRPNPDFVGGQLSTAERMIVASDALVTKTHWWHWKLNIRRHKHNAIHALRDLVPGLRSSVESLQHSRRRASTRASHKTLAEDEDEGGHWHGLSRYMDENDADDHDTWAHIDYARFSTVVDCSSVHLVFYWDSPGLVKEEHFELENSNTVDAVNGTLAPAYGLDLTVRGGNINYGPWTDRLRAEIQAVFFPASYSSATPARALEVGQWRQSTSMTIRVDLEEEVTMRVPTRESSKDWRWRGRATAVRDAAAIKKQRERRHLRHRRGQKGLLGPDIRPFGWISFTVAANSSVRYDMDMVAGASGYTNRLSLDLKQTRATSSVNHADLWRCENQKLQCDLSNPLTWNAQHTWEFNIQNDAMDMYLLRDHMFLLTDLISDFTVGQKSDYMTFVPFEYKIKLQFRDLKLLLNANDYNIIDNPCDMESNAFLILGLRELEGQVDIPMQYFSPSQNSVIFKAEGRDLFLDLKTPVWSTLHSFLKDDNMMTLKSVSLSGSYNYFTGTSNQFTDSLVMDIVGRTPKFHLEGFLIRYFMNVKENYFGDDLHFRTLEEYQSSLAPDNHLVTSDQRRPIKKDNELDVMLNIRAEDSCAFMPTNIYERKENLRVDIMLIEADMRFTNYYMDLQVNSSPIEVSVHESKVREGLQREETTNCQLYISSVAVFGHRLFGAPPTEPTYVCNWDFDIAQISGQCSTQFARVLISAIQTFIFTLDDDENALTVVRDAAIYDITFLRARLDGMRIWLVSDTAAFLVETGQTTVSFNDWAGKHFSKNVRVSAPLITLAAIDTQSVPHRQDRSRTQHPHTLACLQTSLHLAVIGKTSEFEHQRDLQQNHVRFHDLRTSRAGFLLHDQRSFPPSGKETEWSRDAPAMPVPDLPHPAYSSFRIENRQSRSATKQRLQRSKSNFSPRSEHSHSADSDRSGLRVRTSEAQPPCQVRSGINSNTESRRLRGEKGDDSQFSSPWKEPYFPLQAVQPDISNLPVLPLFMKEDRDDETVDFDDFPDADNALPHNAIFSQLSDGVRSFFLPSSFPAVVTLLQQLMPQDATSLLDTIQQATIKHIKELSVEHLGEKLDFALRIPVAALRLINEANSSKRLGEPSSDMYDVLISRARVTGRTAPTIAKQSHGQARGSILLLQASIQDIEVQVEEKFPSKLGDVAGLQISIHDSGFWLSLQDEIRAKAQLGTLQISTGGGTVDRLSMLAERSRVMAVGIFDEFARLDDGARAQHLIYHLSRTHPEATDLAFLSRPSYVLRSAGDHIRLADSWKIISRLRQNLNSLSVDQQSAYLDHTECQFEQQRDVARSQIIQFIEHWKTWDGNQEGCRPLLTAIFGASNPSGTHNPEVLDVEVGLYLGQISIVLDPGTQQSELILQSGDISFSQKPILEQASHEDLVRRQTRSRLRLQTWFADVAVNLNWNLIQLSRALVKQMNSSSDTTTHDNLQSTPSSKSNSSWLDLVVIAGTDSARSRIRTPNLNIYMVAKSLKNSLVVHLSDSTFRTTLLVAASSAQLKFASQYKKLFSWKLLSPNIYGSFQQTAENKRRSDVARFAASCDRLRFSMKEDGLYVLEIVDSVIRDETSVIQEVISSIEQKQPSSSSTSPLKSLKLEDVHIGFFLKDYKLQFRLFPTLHYTISGLVARTSIVPKGKSTYAIHVDIKNHRHSLIAPEEKTYQPAAALEIPPINGKVTIRASDDHLRVDARSTLERVRVEAIAVQACIEALLQPRNKTYLNSAKSLLDRIQTSIKHNEKFPHSEQAVVQPKSRSQRQLLYTANGVFEGIDIYCTAPAAHSEDHEVDLRFGLREMTLKVYNAGNKQTKSFEQPQFEMNLRELFVELSRRIKHQKNTFGHFGVGIRLVGSTQTDEHGDQVRNYEVHSKSLQLDLFTETAALVVDMITFIQKRISEMTTAEERKKIRPLRRLTLANNELSTIPQEPGVATPDSTQPSNLLDTTFALNLNGIRIRWIIVEDKQHVSSRDPEDMVFSIRQIDFRTQREGSARLKIIDTQLQTVSKAQEDPTARTVNSALLPEMIFNAAHFATKRDRRFAFQAAGKALDLRLAADGIVALATIQNSLAQASTQLRSARAIKSESEGPSGISTTKFLGNKRLASLLVDADFAGAVVTITPGVEKEPNPRSSDFSMLKGPRRSRAGRYGQAVQSGGNEDAVLRAPGIAMKIEYIDTGHADPTLSTEVKVAASSNTLAPSVVTLVMEIYSSVKEIIGDDSSQDAIQDLKLVAPKYLTDAADPQTDPTAILGRIKLNAALWVRRQEFSLTCQPIARVAATAKFDDIFVTVNTVQDTEHERFFATITTFKNLQVSVQHVYSRESTASFEVDSIVISLMNSKHVNAKKGISAILNVSPMKASLNAKQMQDFLLFREIWYPAELRQSSKPPTSAPSTHESQAYAMQRYHELAATAALPWHAVISIQELKLAVDFGQSLGKSSFAISKLWASSKKNSDWEQNLCIGFDRIGIDSSGRMSGFIELRQMSARTSIRWPVTKDSGTRAPLVQASIGFEHIRMKAAFDYQPFAVADISSFEFLMYNVRPTREGDNDRLVGILNGGKVQVFCISAAAAQALSIVQAFERLFQEKKDAFQDSIREVDKFLRRKSVFPGQTSVSGATTETQNQKSNKKQDIHFLHTDVVVTLKAVDIGAFPNTFFDSQILKIEAVDAQARFAVATISGKVRSGLGMTLGQVRVALSAVGRANTKALGEVEIDEVVDRATASRGGTILKVPRVVASMQTWQTPQAYTIEYIFRSTFQGKVDVGWNYSRIRFIRGMWETHSQALAHRLGKPLPPAAVKITAEAEAEGAGGSRQEKITAVVNMPQTSKFEYVALEPPVIETPQLRDMGEATPPLEWIGLHRDKLPNVTHSIVIITLLEVAKEVEDAYTKILGTG